MRIYIQDLGVPEISAAARELRYFLSRFSPDTVTEDTASADAVIRLETVEAEDRGYSVTRGTDDGGRPVVSVRGSDGAAVLYAVYRLLERGGMYFDIGGHGLKAGYSVIDTEKMLGDAGEKVVFDFRRRGIRQHINFPMDVSSWRLGEAKEYIRSIARAGYDHITFHSYSGMWHNADSAYGGGGFFYNQLYRLPQDEELRKLIDNEEIYCVPEFEPYADDRQARGRAANRWLNSLISVAHKHLMSVTLSIEPLGSDDPAAQINMARRVLEGYPDIDCLEIISAECGGSTPAFDASELAERLCEYFGEAAVVPEKLPDRIDANIAGAMHSLRAAKQIYDALRDRELKGKSFSAGMYITTAEALNIIKPIMFRLFDESVTMSFLTSYGSYHVAENLREMSFTADELRRTMIYAWLEFDGSMYMMQNGSEGMECVFRLVRDVMGGKQAGCVAFNHWRTAENLLPGSYGAAAGAGFIPAKEYYAVYGEKYALGEGFAPLMAEIAEADLLLREKLFNIGFCYLGCYLNWGGDDPVSWLAAYPEDALESARAIYLDAARRAEELAESCGCADGISRLRLISSRCRASAKHIDYVLAMRSLSVYGKDGASDDASRSEIAGIISKAQGFATEYMRILSSIMPDRGCQGTLVSYNCTILPYIDFIRRALLENDRSKTRYGATFDCPLPQG